MLVHPVAICRAAPRSRAPGSIAQGLLVAMYHFPRQGSSGGIRRLGAE